LNKYWHTNSLNGLTEADFVQIAFQKIISGKRRWKEELPLKKMVCTAICSEIYNTNKKFRKNINVSLDDSKN